MPSNSKKQTQGFFVTANAYLLSSLVGISLLSSNLPAFAEQSKEPATQQTRKITLADLQPHTNIVSGSFEQSQTIPKLDKPAISTGRYIYWKDTGLYWELETPYFFAQTMQGEKVFDWASQDLDSISSSPDSSTAALILKLISTIISSDQSRIDKLFNYTIESNSDNWSVVFKPKHRQLKKHVASISTNGNTAINSIELAFTNNSSMTLDLKNPSFFDTADDLACQKIKLQLQCS